LTLLAIYFCAFLVSVVLLGVVARTGASEVFNLLLARKI
jgi:hypothetical protein